jgi:hypothetical protein
VRGLLKAGAWGGSEGLFDHYAEPPGQGHPVVRFAERATSRVIHHPPPPTPGQMTSWEKLAMDPLSLKEAGGLRLSSACLIKDDGEWLYVYPPESEDNSGEGLPMGTLRLRWQVGLRRIHIGQGRAALCTHTRDPGFAYEAWTKIGVLGVTQPGGLGAAEPRALAVRSERRKGRVAHPATLRPR